MNTRTSLILWLLLTITFAQIPFSASLAAPGGRPSHSSHYTPPHQTYQTGSFDYKPKTEDNQNRSHEEDTELGKVDRTTDELDQERGADSAMLQPQQDQKDQNESDSKGDYCEDSDTTKPGCDQ